MGKIDLKALTAEGMKEFVKGLGLPAYRAGQMLHWIYEKGADSTEEMTELPKDLMARLSGVSYMSRLTLMDEKTSKDGTRKFLFGLEDGLSIESVLIPDGDRLTLCISTQVGCAMACGFCLTGKMGLKRNLKAHEIAGQVLAAKKLAGRPVTNVVLMGMGEPLMNFDETVEALWRMTGLMRISPRRITLSTSGIVPRLLEFPKKAPAVNLAISLNATTDEVRDRIMPVNKKYPLKTLFEALRKYPLKKRRRITFEYVLLKGVNDTPDDAKRLVGLLRGIPSKVNLIPFNPYEGCEFQGPKEETVLGFQEVLTGAGLSAFIRKSKGADIMAACGQLAGGGTATP